MNTVWTNSNFNVDPGGASFPRFSFLAPISMKYPISSCMTNSSMLFKSFGLLGLVNIAVRVPSTEIRNLMN